MEGCYGSLGDHEQYVQNWKIIKHPLYQPRTSPWFDLRIFYMRFSNFEVDESTPEHLTLNHIPLNPDTIFEVNGRRSSSYSECVTSLLRRDRVDKKIDEATFISTDSIRMTGSARFDVYDKDDLLFSGVLELSNSNGFVGESKSHCKRWSISCQQVMTTGSGFLKVKQLSSPESFLPSVDVFVTGCFSGAPIILTKTLQLGFRKNRHQTARLDSIPENELTQLRKYVSSEALQRRYTIFLVRRRLGCMEVEMKRRSSVKAAYCVLADSGTGWLSIPFIWHSMTPLKVKFFMRRISHIRLQTCVIGRSLCITSVGFASSLQFDEGYARLLFAGNPLLIWAYCCSNDRGRQ